MNDQCIITREEIDDDSYYQHTIYNYKEFNFIKYKDELERNIKDMHNDITYRNCDINLNIDKFYKTKKIISYNTSNRKLAL